MLLCPSEYIMLADVCRPQILHATRLYGGTSEHREILFFKISWFSFIDRQQIFASHKKMVGVLRHLPSLAYVFEMCRKKSRAKLFWEVYGDPRGHRGHLHEVWKVYVDHMGS